MKTSSRKGCLPQSRGTKILLAVLLVFATLMVAIFLWFDVQLKTIDEQLEKLPQSENQQTIRTQSEKL